jgi:hypothetical protein
MTPPRAAYAEDLDFLTATESGHALAARDAPYAAWRLELAA